MHFEKALTTLSGLTNILVAGLLWSNSMAILALFLLGRGSPQFRAQIHPLIPSMQPCAQSTRMFST